MASYLPRSLVLAMYQYNGRFTNHGKGINKQLLVYKHTCDVDAQVDASKRVYIDFWDAEKDEWVDRDGRVYD